MSFANKRMTFGIKRMTFACKRMTFANGDTKLMTFDDVVPNAAVDPGAFAIAR